MEKLLWWLKTIPFKKNIYLCIWLCWVLVVEHGIFSCGIWDLVPWPGIKPSSPVLEHSVLTTGPPGKSQTIPILKTTSIKHLRLSSTLCKGKGEQFLWVIQVLFSFLPWWAYEKKLLVFHFWEKWSSMLISHRIREDTVPCPSVSSCFLEIVLGEQGRDWDPCLLKYDTSNWWHAKWLQVIPRQPFLYLKELYIYF